MPSRLTSLRSGNIASTGRTFDVPSADTRFLGRLATPRSTGLNVQLISSDAGFSMVIDVPEGWLPVYKLGNLVDK